ncbi:uncharacterized protein LOC112885218 [Panicum hallii]|uniref:uncharacterized protein LOC112885218 n=1 Tax=Panicum hallii TaxID=206008 RepID=UPI000DF4E4EE|nr:uncharacterized protein LOC112885218 [Panicum hallii]
MVDEHAGKEDGFSPPSGMRPRLDGRGMGGSRAEEQVLDILMPPPIHPDDPGSGPLPGSILLNPEGYISDRTNDTTADGFTKDGKRIQVAFWVAHPPRASCFTVHVPELGSSAIGDIPKILCTEEDLAGTKDKPPSLQLIPTPPSLLFADKDAGLLRCRYRRGNMYFIAFLCRDFTNKEFILHLYNSKSKSWSNKLMHLDSPKAKEYTYTSKVITIGGEHGSVGWSDLCKGILICDLLREKNNLRYIPLTPLLRPNLPETPPLLFRDINVFGKGCIEYFDMYLYIGSGLVVGSSHMEQEGFFDREAEPTRPILKGVYSGFPALSLHDDDVVYLKDKYDLMGTKASVLAVDMRSQTLKGVADFGSGRPLGYSYIYFQSAISKYLGLWSSTRY